MKQVYFNIFFTTRLALAQSLAQRHQFGKLNGWLEIENQAAAFSAGALALILLDHLSVQAIFITCGFMLVPATYLFSSLPSLTAEKKNVESDDACEANTIPAEQLRSGKTSNYDLSLYFIIVAGNVPFVCIMLLDVIRPIFISDILHETPFALALSAMLYTLGAIGGGIYGGRLKVNRVLYGHLVAGILAFCLTNLVLVRHANIELFYLASFGWGAFNALSRVAAQTIIMHSVDNLYIGRFLSKAQRVILFLRVSSMILYAVIFRYVDYGNSFLFLLLLSLVGPSLLGLQRFRKRFQ